MPPSPTKKPPSSPRFRVQRRESYQQPRDSTRLAACFEREVASHGGLDQLAIVASSDSLLAASSRRRMYSSSMKENPNSDGGIQSSDSPQPQDPPHADAIIDAETETEPAQFLETPSSPESLDDHTRVASSENVQPSTVPQRTTLSISVSSRHIQRPLTRSATVTMRLTSQGTGLMPTLPNSHHHISACICGDTRLPRTWTALTTTVSTHTVHKSHF